VPGSAEDGDLHPGIIPDDAGPVDRRGERLLR
jgi:hypothetical protein